MENKKPYCIIFDMDGVLIDTEPYYLQMGVEILKNEGIEITTKEFEKYVGLSSIKMWQDIIDSFHLTSRTPDYFIDQSKARLQDLLDNNEEYPPHVPGVINFLEKFNSLDYGVASSTSLPFIKKCLDKANMIPWFEKLTSGHEVENGKPAPDVFLLAANRLNYLPEKCIVIEDSRNGTLAASSAGMVCIGLKNELSGQQDLSAADFVADNYEEIATYILALDDFSL